MQINREPPNSFTIQAYSETEVKINSVIYTKSLIISTHELIQDWPLRDVTTLENYIDPLLGLKPEVIIIGHSQLGKNIPIPVLEKLSKLRIGLECMSIGAACRTFNLLLNEQRAVVVGLVF